MDFIISSRLKEGYINFYNIISGDRVYWGSKNILKAGKNDGCMGGMDTRYVFTDRIPAILRENNDGSRS